MKKASNERVGGPLTVNISDSFRGVTTPGSKSLASADNNSSIRDGSWGQLVGRRCLLVKVGHIIGVCQARCSHPDGYCRNPNVC